MKMTVFIFQFIQRIIYSLFHKYIIVGGKISRKKNLNGGSLEALSFRLYRWKFFHDFMKRNTYIHFFDKETSKNTRFIFLLSFICLILSCVIITIVVLVSVIIILNLMIFILNISPSSSTDKAVALLSAIGTMGAAIFAARSAIEVSLSNKLIRENNINEDFYRKFNILLDKHDNYLSLINDFFKKETSAIFKIEYLSTLSCNNALKIVRGINDKIYGSIKSSEELTISEGNSFAKNVLSPYMRILYHILKSIDIHFNNDKSLENKDAKQYSNIIRSLIPNDLLLLVALNSVIFYKSSGDKTKFKDRMKSISDNLSIYNDYHKFFKLLNKYDFFEHLNVNTGDEYNSYNINDFSISHLDIHDNLYSVKLKRGNCYVITKSGEFHFENIMKKITNELKKLPSLDVIGLFYFYDDNRKLAKDISSVIIKELEKIVDSKTKECSSELDSHDNHSQLRYNNIDDFINHFDLSRIKIEIELGAINPKEEIIVINECYFFGFLFSGSFIITPR